MSVQSVALQECCHQQSRVDINAERPAPAGASAARIGDCPAGGWRRCEGLHLRGACGRGTVPTLAQRLRLTCLHTARQQLHATKTTSCHVILLQQLSILALCTTGRAWRGGHHTPWRLGDVHGKPAQQHCRRVMGCRRPCRLQTSSTQHGRVVRIGAAGIGSPHRTSNCCRWRICSCFILSPSSTTLHQLCHVARDVFRCFWSGSHAVGAPAFCGGGGTTSKCAFLPTLHLLL